MAEIPTPCEPRIKGVQVAHIGRRYQFICSCGTKSPLASKEVAELAYHEHTGEQP